MTTENVQIQLHRDTAANWTSINTVLLAGEVGIESDTLKFKIGDGVTAWNSLRYAGTAHKATFSVAGALTVTSYTMRYYVETIKKITSVRASVGTAPVGAAIIVDVKKNGTSIFATTPANRPTIAVSTNTALSGTPDTVAMAAGDYLTIQIVQIGSSTAGSDLTVQVEML